MILPIYTFGQEVLRKKGTEIAQDYPELNTLIENMFETMYAANGVGLAAPQIGLPIRLFVIDTTKWEEAKNAEKFKQAFINAEIIEEWDEPWKFEEGCLSIPGIRENVSRKGKIKIQYLDEHFNAHLKEFSGIAARVIQHEYDHIEGILFTDKINPLRKKFLQNKLKEMSKGKVRADYPIKPSRK
ncbi:MAG: peptide deformylase [Bacteroidia bacterium]|nr:peptide deformylase [Bacteroidia bacterium]